MKRPAMPRRTTRIRPVSEKRAAKLAAAKRRTATIARTSALRKRNAKRRETAFQYAYHSRARVRFVKSLPCLVCVLLSPFFVTGRPSDNAHTGKKPGKGLKAHYTTIVPLCRNHHRRYDEHRPPFHTAEMREAIAADAARIEELWQEHIRLRGAA